MFRTAGCPYCARWDREIGAIYDKTDEGRRLPLRMVDMTAPRPDEFTNIRAIVFSPTFVVTERGREIGRITGYTGQDFFWGLLGGILNMLPTEQLSEHSTTDNEGRTR